MPEDDPVSRELDDSLGTAWSDFAAGIADAPGARQSALVRSCGLLSVFFHSLDDDSPWDSSTSGPLAALQLIAEGYAQVGVGWPLFTEREPYLPGRETVDALLAHPPVEPEAAMHEFGADASPPLDPSNKVDTIIARSVTFHLDGYANRRLPVQPDGFNEVEATWRDRLIWNMAVFRHMFDVLPQQYEPTDVRRRALLLALMLVDGQFLQVCGERLLGQPVRLPPPDYFTNLLETVGVQAWLGADEDSDS